MSEILRLMSLEAVKVNPDATILGSEKVLVKNLTEQLEGTVELDTQNGAKFTIKFPSNVK